MGEKVYDAGTVTVGNTADAAHVFRRFPDVVRPDITVGISIFLRFHGLPEPLAGNGGMTGYQVQNHMHIPCMRFLKQTHQVGICAVSGRYRIIILHVITGVAEGRKETGVEPESGTA